MKITSVTTHDVRFPTSQDLSGSDAVHKDPDYSCVYVVLTTDDPSCPEGYGLTFTLGRGNEIVASCVKALSFLLVGKDFDEDIVHDMMNSEDHKGFYYQICQEGQLRWLGPEKGAISLAAGAIMNAVWDIMARRAGKPLWEFVSDMEPEKLVQYIDFKHIDDFVTKEEAVALLRKVRPKWQERKKIMKKVGFRAYTTSCGWLGYPLDVVRAKCRESLKEGHRYFKMKVGSKDIQEDMKRAAVIREEIGDGLTLMMDANQKWNVNEAIKNMKLLSKFNPIWIEEPTNCDDVVGHQTINKALQSINGGKCGVATGEVMANKVLFKQLLQLNAVRYVQIDSCRVCGVSEILSILLMSAKADVKVCPHAGGVGLCEYVRHLCMIDFVCFNPKDELDRICESVSECKYFYDNISFNKTDDGLFYKPAVLPGYARMREEYLKAYSFPFGSKWYQEKKGEQAANAMVQNAKDVLSADAKNRGERWSKNDKLNAVGVAAAFFAGCYYLLKRE